MNCLRNNQFNLNILINRATKKWNCNLRLSCINNNGINETKLVGSRIEYSTVVCCCSLHYYHNN